MDLDTSALIGKPHAVAADRIAEVITRLVRDRTAVARRDGSEHTIFPVAVSPEEGEALGSWVVSEKATTTIEVGLGYGISALFICDALCTNDVSAAEHVAIDPNQSTRFADCGLQFLEDAGLRDIVEFIPEDSLLALPRLLGEGRTFDLAFVDGNHRFDGVFVDLVYLGRLVRPGGIVFLDDYQLPAVARAASFFVTNLGWTIEEVSAPHGQHQWAVLRTATAPDTRPFKYFVDF